MKITRFDEPWLQFGVNKHIDIRFGLMHYNPLDFDQDDAPKKIKVGIIGSAVSIEGIRDWLEKCRTEIAAKESRHPNLFPKFPGFNSKQGFCSDIYVDSSLERQLPPTTIDSICKLPVSDEQKVLAVDAIADEVRQLLEKKPDIVVCALPQKFLDAFEPSDSGDGGGQEEPEGEAENVKRPIDFHDLLKARCLALPRACPLQLVLPATYDPKKRRRGKSKSMRPLQDEATRAWNFHTALYYKAGGIPWKLVEDTSKLQTCFVGVGFFRTPNDDHVSTSVAQIFNERGNGVVVKGEPAIFEKEDRQLHLDGTGAYSLLCRALHEYRNEHKTMPARVVIHKTSIHNDAEIDGFEKAAREKSVEYCEMISLRRSGIRLFRSEEYPPLRGMFLSLDTANHILYTRGSVEFYGTYPGMYMPRTLQIRCDKTHQTARFHGEEILSLTKMNWNDTQFDGGMPITVRAARQVGDILKYTGPNDIVPSQYGFYM